MEYVLVLRVTTCSKLEHTHRYNILLISYTIVNYSAIVAAGK